MLKLYEQLTWRQIEEAKDNNELFALSMGAIEQHGYHLPVSVDHVIPYEILKQRISPHVDMVLLPPIYYGYRSQTTVGGGDQFPGTLRMSSESVSFTIRDIVSELARHGIKKLLISDGHLENQYFVIDGIERARKESHEAENVKVMYSQWVDYVKKETLDAIFEGHFPGFELEHAAINETSLMLALRPDLVVFDDYPDETPERNIHYMVWPSSPDLVTNNGALSTAIGSSAEKGEMMLKDIVEGMLDDIEYEFGGVY